MAKLRTILIPAHRARGLAIGDETYSTEFGRCKILSIEEKPTTDRIGIREARVEVLPMNTITITKLPHAEQHGDWHDKPLKWSVGRRRVRHKNSLQKRMLRFTEKSGEAVMVNFRRSAPTR